MDIEQLKLILETISKAGEGAFIIAIMWMIKGYLVPILIFTAVLICSKWSVGIIANAIKQDRETQSFLDTVRTAAGCQTPWGGLTSEEKRKVLSKISQTS